MIDIEGPSPMSGTLAAGNQTPSFDQDKLSRAAFVIDDKAVALRPAACTHAMPLTFVETSSLSLVRLPSISNFCNDGRLETFCGRQAAKRGSPVD